MNAPVSESTAPIAAAPILIRYFAGLREQIGMAEEHVHVPVEVRDVAALRVWLAARGGDWSRAFAPGCTLRAAVNQTMARPDTCLDGAHEVAFFPPVTGG